MPGVEDGRGPVEHFAALHGCLDHVLHALAAIPRHAAAAEAFRARLQQITASGNEALQRVQCAPLLRPSRTAAATVHTVMTPRHAGPPRWRRATSTPRTRRSHAAAVSAAATPSRARCAASCRTSSALSTAASPRTRSRSATTSPRMRPFRSRARPFPSSAAPPPCPPPPPRRPATSARRPRASMAPPRAACAARTKQAWSTAPTPASGHAPWCPVRGPAPLASSGTTRPPQQWAARPLGINAPSILRASTRTRGAPRIGPHDVSMTYARPCRPPLAARAHGRL